MKTSEFDASLNEALKNLSVEEQAWFLAGALWYVRIGIKKDTKKRVRRWNNWHDNKKILSRK